MSSFLHSLPIDRVSGLSPEVWLSVGAGFSREDVKALILSQGRGFVGDSIINLQELCFKLTGLSQETLLSSAARQEVLRTLLTEPRILADLPELKRIRRQRQFVRRLDFALQSGRIAAAHDEEETVYDERLVQLLGPSPLRKELQALSKAFDAWLRATGHVDGPELIRRAIQCLREEGWPQACAKPQEIWCLSTEIFESLERDFWELVQQSVEVKQVKGFFQKTDVAKIPQFKWQQWHTLDDAAEAFVDQVLLQAPLPAWDDHVLLIPDIPVIRRSLNRALRSRKIPLADPRDPTRLRWDETIKWAMLPLEVMVSNFERKKVISWLRASHFTEEFSAAVNEIQARGIRSGLGFYSGGLLVNVHSRLHALKDQFSGRKTCDELAQSHLDFLRKQIGSDAERTWLLTFFETTWAAFGADLLKIGQHSRRAPLLFWLERLQARLSEASPPVERLKPEKGVRIYRLQQAPLFSAKKVWIFGMPSHWLTGEGLGNYWFSEREREILSTEFSIRSSFQVREERMDCLRSWMAESEEVVVLDSHYQSNGREAESILPVIKELQIYTGLDLPDVPEDCGSHARFAKSYSVFRPLQAQEIQLPSIPLGPAGEVPTFSATLLDHMSRCSFQALGYHRWRLSDVREAERELWPDVKGRILHEAVRRILKSLDSQGAFLLSPKEALEQAWKQHRPKGLIHHTRVESYIQSRLIGILEIFCEKEREFLTQAKTSPLSLDDLSLRLEFPTFTLIGKPDRIDIHPEGLFLIDYKSSGTSPNGTEMVERGYRLQLPIYALAAQKHFGKPVIGAQFVELTRKGVRRNGIFFKEFNGKESGKLTKLRSNSKSLLDRSPADVWSELEGSIHQNATDYREGRFQAKPNTDRREKECGRCRLADLCGWRRLIKAEEEERDSDE